jgi:hypothetical protein
MPAVAQLPEDHQKKFDILPISVGTDPAHDDYQKMEGDREVVHGCAPRMHSDGS